MGSESGQGPLKTQHVFHTVSGGEFLVGPIKPKDGKNYHIGLSNIRRNFGILMRITKDHFFLAEFKSNLPKGYPFKIVFYRDENSMKSCNYMEIVRTLEIAIKSGLSKVGFANASDWKVENARKYIADTLTLCYAPDNLSVDEDFAIQTFRKVLEKWAGVEIKHRCGYENHRPKPIEQSWLSKLIEESQLSKLIEEDQLSEPTEEDQLSEPTEEKELSEPIEEKPHRCIGFVVEDLGKKSFGPEELSERVSSLDPPTSYGSVHGIKVWKSVKCEATGRLAMEMFIYESRFPRLDWEKVAARDTKALGA